MTTPEVGIQMPVVDGKLPCDGRYWEKHKGDDKVHYAGRRSGRGLSTGAVWFWYISAIEKPPVFVDPPGMMLCNKCGNEYPDVRLDIGICDECEAKILKPKAEPEPPPGPSAEGFVFCEIDWDPTGLAKFKIDGGMPICISDAYDWGAVGYYFHGHCECIYHSPVIQISIDHGAHEIIHPGYEGKIVKATHVVFQSETKKENG